MSIPSDRPMVCPVVIGRNNYLDSISRFLENAHNPAGPTILITGEAGIGKSRLVSEAKKQAARRGLLILQGNCFEPDRNFLYGPLLDLLRSFFASQTSETTGQLLGSTAQELVKLLPELTFRLPGLKPTPLLEPEQEKHRLFYSLLQLFNQLAAAQPLLVIIEDLHWCDDTSLEFLLQLVRRTTSQSIVVLLTYRNEEVNPGLDHFLAGVERERLATEWPLKQLSSLETDQMLQAIFELKQPTRPQFLNKIYSLTEGNPFFIEEVLRALITEGEIFYDVNGWERKAIDELHIPRSVLDAVQRRIQQLSSPAKSLLNLAAVAGRRFDFSLLQNLTGKAESELMELLKELIAAQLVVEVSAERFGFKHALTRQAIYLGLLTRERQILHSRFGETLERLYANALDSHLDELAYHFYEAGSWAKALAYSQKLGEKASALFAPGTAVEHFSRTLEAAKNLGVNPSPQLYQARGRAYETLGEFDLARADQETALHIAQTNKDQAAQWEALRHLGMLWAGRDYARTGQYYRQAYDLARQMANPLILAHSLNWLGNWHLNVASPRQALDYHRQALVIFRELGEQPGLAETLDLLGLTSCLEGDMIQCRAYYEQAIKLFGELNDRAGLASVLATLPLCSGAYQTSLTVSVILDQKQIVSEAETGLKIAQEIGQRSAEAFGMLMLSSYLGLHGEYGRALELAKASLKIAQEIGHQQWTTTAHFTLGALYFDLLDLTQAQQQLEQALDLSKAIGSLFWEHCTVGYLALVYIAQGKGEQAQAVLDLVLKTSAAPQMVGQKLVWFARAELARYSGDLEQAFQLVEELIIEARNQGSVITPAVPRLLHLQGLLRLAGAAGESEEAQKQTEAALRAASQAADQQGVKPLQWRIQLELGNLYQTLDRYEEAQQAFSTARAIIEQLAANLPDELLQTTFRRTAAKLFPDQTRPLSGRVAKEPALNLLTGRELEVLGLVAAGLSNAQVAEKLSISVSTVNVHLNSIYGKLDVKSRTAATHYALEHKLI